MQRTTSASSSVLEALRGAASQYFGGAEPAAAPVHARQTTAEGKPRHSRSPTRGGEGRAHPAIDAHGSAPLADEPATAGSLRVATSTARHSSATRAQQSTCVHELQVFACVFGYRRDARVWLHTPIILSLTTSRDGHVVLDFGPCCESCLTLAASHNTTNRSSRLSARHGAKRGAIYERKWCCNLPPSRGSAMGSQCAVVTSGVLLCIVQVDIHKQRMQADERVQLLETEVCPVCVAMPLPHSVTYVALSSSKHKK